MADWKIHATFDGPVVMIGFGSIGSGTLPLILRHIDFDPADMVIVDPTDANRAVAEEYGIRFLTKAITADGYREVLTPLLTAGGRRGFCVNLSVDVSSVAIMELCLDLGCLYIDTVAEPWLGYYTDPDLTISQRSNYALREKVLDLRRKRPDGPTAVSCCGANPGMVSWFVKQAMINLAGDLKLDVDHPVSREDWARLAQRLGVKGIHIAERDTQRARAPKPQEVFVNTWSVEGFISEGLQPAELGWGTHEKALPPDGREHDSGCGAAIYLMRPGAGTKVRSWTPTAKAQHGFLITHNEAISIADYFTVREGETVAYLPLCLSPLQRRRAVAARDGGPPVAGANRTRHPGREGHRRRYRRAGRAALRPRPERLLVRFAALHRGDPAARALSERDRPAGHVGGAGGDGLGAGEPRARHRRGR